MPFRRVRVIVLGFAVVGSLTGCRSGPSDLTDEDRSAVRRQIDMYVQASLAGDFEQWGKTLADDVVVMPPNAPAPIAGRAAVLGWVKSLPRLTAFKVDPAEVTGSGDTAVARGTYSLTMAMPDGTAVKDGGSFLEVHRRSGDGTWPYTQLMFLSDQLASLAGGAGPETEKQLVQLERDWCTADMKKDAALMGQILADDASIVGSRGRVFTKSELLADLKDATSTLSVCEDSDVKVRMYGNVAVVTGRGTRSGSLRGQAYKDRRIFYTDTFVWRNGRWQCVASQATPAAS